MSLQKARIDLNHVLKTGILYLSARGYSDTQIGQIIGYADGQMVGKVKNGSDLFGPVPLALFSRLCAAEGYYSVAEHLAGPGMLVIPAPDASSIDGDPLGELRAMVECIGDTSKNFETDARAAHEASARAVAASVALHMETLAKIKAEEST